MKKLLLLLILTNFTFTLSVNTFAEDKPAQAEISLDDVINKSLLKIIDKIKDTKGKVAVMDFPGLDGNSTGLSSYIANKAGNKLIEASRQVVDRSTLEKVISEQKLQQNALMDAATAAKVGKLAGAGVFIVGNYTKTESRFVLTVRALSVELGQFIPGAVSEETVKPLTAEFNKDLAEFIKIRVANNNQIDLNGASQNATESNPAEDPGILKKEIEFDTKVCKMIDIKSGIGKIYKLAQQLHYMELDDLLSINGDEEAADSTGEKRYAVKIGNWMLANDGGTIGPEAKAQFIKGQDWADRGKILAWTYSGAHKIAGIEKCSPNVSWWTTKRGK
jgi:hypothetical protein